MFFLKIKRFFYKYKYKKSKLLRIAASIILFGFLVGFFSLSNPFHSGTVAVSTNHNIKEPSVLINELGKVLKLFDVTTDMKLQQIISDGCPSIFYFEDQETHKGKKLGLWTILGNGLAYITDLHSNDPTTLFKSQMAVFASVDMERQQITSSYTEEGEEDFYLDTPSGLEEWLFEVKKAPVEMGKEPVVLLYNSHNAETYKPTDGVSKVEGKNGGIVTVAQVMEETLENSYGLKTVRSNTIHDYPDWTRSYINSMRTVQGLLGSNPTIQAVFDIHRDAGFADKKTTTSEINGKSSASILIIVGTEHPRWRENLAFAQKLEAKANSLYPGLVRDIRILNNRRYNQQLHPQALLLEIGSDLNTLEEAKYCITLFSHVTAEVLKGN